MYLISLVGCDGITEITRELTEEQLQLLKELVAESERKSPYSCYPVLDVKPITQEQADKLEAEYQASLD